MDHASLSIQGMNCAHCVTNVQNALNEVPGVQDVKVYLDSMRADVTYDSQRVSIENLVAALKRAGYEPFISEDRLGRIPEEPD